MQQHEEDCDNELQNSTSNNSSKTTTTTITNNPNTSINQGVPQTLTPIQLETLQHQ